MWQTCRGLALLRLFGCKLLFFGSLLFIVDLTFTLQLTRPVNRCLEDWRDEQKKTLKKVSNRIHTWRTLTRYNPVLHPFFFFFPKFPNLLREPLKENLNFSSFKFVRLPWSAYHKKREKPVSSKAKLGVWQSGCKKPLSAWLLALVFSDWARQKEQKEGVGLGQNHSPQQDLWIF